MPLTGTWWVLVDDQAFDPEALSQVTFGADGTAQVPRTIAARYREDGKTILLEVEANGFFEQWALDRDATNEDVLSGMITTWLGDPSDIHADPDAEPDMAAYCTLVLAGSETEQQLREPPYEEFE